jgi:hypothetical protein
VLVAVGIQVAGGQRRIGLDIVAELDDLEVQTVLGSNLFDHFHDLRVRAGGHADLDGLVLGLGGKPRVAAAATANVVRKSERLFNMQIPCAKD